LEPATGSAKDGHTDAAEAEADGGTQTVGMTPEEFDEAVHTAAAEAREEPSAHGYNAGY